ncbi:cell division protein ZapE [Prosthecodimorpha staleyi]|uniref:AFG1 family ATPase n=1 Tax=Prosthecodimorpha staleyi TaxID=2840188 RepID=A0A947DBJ3_9HYPH|nr:cell division protein ZapE [Prosthecodimorpha staleyi]MBT9292707.1 AFG1 family ATPase [Prosthecodimorpha staleyi]
MGEAMPAMRTVTERYEHLVATGAIGRDPAQVDLVNRLDRLADELGTAAPASKGSALGWIFGRRMQANQKSVRGLYVWGKVGRGKTMLMDLFFERAQVSRKRRAHFHAFMSEVQDRIHAARQAILKGEIKGDDPIAPVAADIAKEARLLCFDEFVVTDIADAMILGRLFARLWEAGTCVVATSNVEPDRLYWEGLNRPLFLPFIDLLKANMTVLELDSRTDFRSEKEDIGRVYFAPLGPEAVQAIDAIWNRLTGGAVGEMASIDFRGRKIAIPRAVGGIARFSFADLCERPLAAADYLKIAGQYHTVMLEGVPLLGPEKRNEAKRFIHLVDALYDNHIRLVLTAAAEPQGLYRGGEGTEAFEFRRTVSRLMEMRSAEYLALPQNPSQSSR